ncbi:uncharacterized protein YjiS (DUF1127 family) [Chelatococcus caeni]|uniref:Uncharacterized protein YjiS (DUF1127 family) n=1 Tax=Chelatococcus caeni TaxID=1348468 RepID=A0A840BS46_9HYPH|nr:DUF1127 domain-containing protein [Chelatococcus caeni]MBB4016215.1 uncharacterized protein YjiS (DUF1127 family) [Chelatococcus caeni]
MSALDHVTPFHASRHARFPSLRIVAGALADMRRFMRLRQARRDLHELPDYLLLDVGIDRSQIDDVTAFSKHGPAGRDGY